MIKESPTRVHPSHITSFYSIKDRQEYRTVRTHMLELTEPQIEILRVLCNFFISEEIRTGSSRFTPAFVESVENLSSVLLSTKDNEVVFEKPSSRFSEEDAACVAVSPH